MLTFQNVFRNEDSQEARSPRRIAARSPSPQEIPALYKPSVKSATDTSNFEDYPDSTEMPPAISPQQDPFEGWSALLLGTLVCGVSWHFVRWQSPFGRAEDALDSNLRIGKY